MLTRADVDRYKLSEEEMRWVQSNFSERRHEPRFARLLDRERSCGSRPVRDERYTSTM